MASTVENDEEPGPVSGGGHTSSIDDLETQIDEPEELPEAGSLEDASQQIQRSLHSHCFSEWTPSGLCRTEGKQNTYFFAFSP